MVCKIGFANWNAKIALLRASIVVTYCLKFLRTGADRHDGILMSLLPLVAETMDKDTIQLLVTFIDHVAKNTKKPERK